MSDKTQLFTGSRKVIVFEVMCNVTKVMTFRIGQLFLPIPHARTRHLTCVQGFVSSCVCTKLFE